jgi:hypothetical protein
VVRHIFQACPVWIYTQSNITSMVLKLFTTFRAIGRQWPPSWLHFSMSRMTEVLAPDIYRELTETFLTTFARLRIILRILSLGSAVVLHNEDCL